MAENKIRLFQSLLTLKSIEEVSAYLQDLLTEQEIVELSKRFQAATMLANKSSYIEIEKTTGLSSTTIARVSKALNSEQAGYKMVLSRLDPK